MFLRPGVNTIVAVDPGWSTGIVWGEVTADTAYVRRGFSQVKGGLELFKVRMMDLFMDAHGTWGFDFLVCEKWKPRPIARNYKLIELEPLRIEGWLDDLTWAWQWPEQRSLTSAGVKASEEILHRKGLWLTKSQLDPEDRKDADDADDVNAAQLHLLAFLRNQGHTPTIEAYLR